MNIETPQHADQQFKIIDDSEKQKIYQQLLKARIYKKCANVEARPATPGEQITTILRREDGTVIKETTNMAKEGDYVVRNPNGEEYIVSGEKFKQRYELAKHQPQAKTEERKWQTYTSKGHVRAIKNQFNQKVKITAPWGEEMIGEPDCMFVIPCDENGNLTDDDGPNQIYCIGKREFEATYEIKTTSTSDPTEAQEEV